MGVCSSIDQLSADPNAVPRALDATFHHMGDTEFFGHLAQIAGNAAFVLHHGRATDHLEVCDLGKIGKNFILHAIGEISVLFAVAQVFEWKNGDTLFRNRKSYVGGFPRRGACNRR